MPGAIDILEKNVAAATSLIESLREAVESLTRELDRRDSDVAAEKTPAPPSPDPALREEIERLRAERVVIRDGIRRLLREIDRVSW